MSEHLQPSQYEIEYANQNYSIAELLGDSFTSPEKASAESISWHRSTAFNTRITIGKVTGTDIVRPTWLAAGTPIDAYTLAELAFFTAGVKSSGQDAGDIIGDNRKLYSQDPEEILRRGRHEVKIDGWNEFLESRERVMAFFERSFSERTYRLSPNSNDTLVPYITWEVIKGKPVITHTPQQHPIIKQLANERLFSQQSPHKTYDNTVGMLLLSGYSPEVTAKWGDTVSYRDKSRTQRHGPLQALVTPWSNKDKLPESFLFQQIRRVGALTIDGEFNPDNTESITKVLQQIGNYGRTFIQSLLQRGKK